MQWFLCSAASDFLGRFGRLAHTVLVESLQASSAMCEAEEACWSAVPQGRRLACRCLIALAFLGPSKASRLCGHRVCSCPSHAAPLCLHLARQPRNHCVQGCAVREPCVPSWQPPQPVVGRLWKFPLSRDCLALSQGFSQFALAHDLLFLICCLKTRADSLPEALLSSDILFSKPARFCLSAFHSAVVASSYSARFRASSTWAGSYS